MKKQVVGQTKNDKTVYVDREGSHAATHISDTPNLLRLVQELISLNREAKPTSFVTIALCRNNKGDYELWSAWIGPAVPQFPGDEHATPESRSFW